MQPHYHEKSITFKDPKNTQNYVRYELSIKKQHCICHHARNAIASTLVNWKSQKSNWSTDESLRNPVSAAASCQTYGTLKTCGCADEHALFGADVEGIKLEISILQTQLNSTNSFTSQSLTENRSDLSIIKNRQKIWQTSIDTVQLMKQFPHA